MITELQLGIDACVWIEHARKVLKGELDVHERPEFLPLFDAIREHLPTEILWAQVLRGMNGQRRFMRSDALYRNRQLVSGTQFYCCLTCGLTIAFPYDLAEIESAPGRLVTFDSRVTHSLGFDANDSWTVTGMCERQ